MAGNEIRTKIKSIQSTQKITRAMEQVAASKMRKTQDRMKASRPYAQRIYEVINHVAHAQAESSSLFQDPSRQVTCEGLVVVTSDRGLCGGLNVNLFRTALSLLEKNKAEGRATKLALVGAKAQQFFKRIGGDVVASCVHLGEAPEQDSVIGVARTMLGLFESGEIQSLRCLNNRFVSSMVQKPTLMNLLPLVSEEGHENGAQRQAWRHWDYVYEGPPQELLRLLVNRFVEAEIFQGVLENIACEQAARMMAMKSASDNASDLIEEMRLVYNKARQAAITQELAEIVSGAAAV